VGARAGPDGCEKFASTWAQSPDRLLVVKIASSVFEMRYVYEDCCIAGIRD
jgi:hypothetical protein